MRSWQTRHTLASDHSSAIAHLTLAALLFATLVAASAPAAGQGLLVNVNASESARLPRPPGVWPPHPPRPTPPPPATSYKIKELAVQSRIEDQIAQVQVSQSFVNTGSRVMEVCFLFPLPYDGAIDRLTLLVDGKEYEAKLLEATEARRIYEDIVRKNKDPALLEWMGRGMFKTSVFPVPPGAERKVTLRYSQLCRHRDGLTDFTFPLATAKYTSAAVEKVDFRVTIASDEKIKNVYSPSHEVDIKRSDDQHATITYTRTNTVPSSDFRLFYDVDREKLSTKVISYRPKADEDGFFLLLASPEIEQPAGEVAAKTVIFVVDRSGSMQGTKIEQARGALKFVLNNLREGDTFNIVAYDSAVESFRPELQRFDDPSRQSALGFVEGLYAGGSTNIDGALKTALGMLTDSTRPSYVIFLTDGLPTVGEQNEMKIAAAAHEANQVGARVFSFGVGYDVNSRLLDRLSASEKGHSFFVRPNENIEERVSQMYGKISAPVMTDVAITFDVEGLRTEEGGAVNRVYPATGYDLFAGDQLVVVGRYKKPGRAKVTVRGKVGDEAQSFDFPAELVNSSSDQSYAFVEKLWAMRRIGEIIDELDLEGSNQELIDELVALSTAHGILTPYTSFLADENSNWRDARESGRRAGQQLEGLGEASGARAFRQRRAKAGFKRAQSADSQASAGSNGLPAFGFADDGEAADRDEAAPPALVRIGRKTFYRRDGRQVDAAVTEAMEQNATRIERFSKEYFDLVERHGDEAARCLALDGPVVLELGGVTYLVE
ncbi:MAG: VWA domain-containing protein [Planctomycetota bacterium]|nr:MAG: VWA domain-containing protein [Planctomycetota bacterium]